MIATDLPQVAAYRLVLVALWGPNPTPPGRERELLLEMYKSVFRHLFVGEAA